ncbi:1,4-dihydroxy-2-naphthoate octaprenyltransferase [Anaerobiospirillum sp. NML02-A-032]|uniref:1,4-dihydroxy-2-naphthoate octaprenyltransferase n=1 Tax=Anaerobiospirillum sp. NML02-A-032 TaxID=2932818 RepID=UPI001FF45379|nr:1,4-dihydroxy-2-naphthoate octaprenyltransferase [Anaerobiospirillum sp. NML02-A-032]MCK0539054.1 1,4-dihydroxy-2-naphthoate octaprenyltransferase [Anaerobiospirillum sp. NML02-A-032]
MIKDWIKEARPQTLLLGATNCAVGCGLGFYYGAVNAYNIAAAFLIIVTGMLLQILSNLANDYGDAFKGADGANRLGPIRGVMTGAISLKALKRFMAIVTIMLSVTGITAVYMTLGNDSHAFAWFVFLGVISILAAILYTLGVSYGYRGLGDVSVFLFFGVLAVIGPQLMITNASGSGFEIYPDTIMLCLSVGAGSVMVLHTANMRDIAEDTLNGKRTLAVRLGYRLASIYHAFLFCLRTGVLIPCLLCFPQRLGNQHSGSGLNPSGLINMAHYPQCS